MDGLAIQLALGDPDLGPSRFRELWLQAAALELDIDPAVFRAVRPVRQARQSP